MKTKIKEALVVMFLSVSFISFGNHGFSDTVIDFKNEVIDFSETGLNENIRSGQLVSLSPLDLKIGSVFVDVDGIAKKVSNITRNGDEVIIDTVKPELREVFEYFDIPPQTIDLSIEDNLVIDSLPEGATVSQSDRASTKKTVTFDVTKKSGEYVTTNISGSATMDVKVSVGGRLPYTYIDRRGTWKVWKWRTRYVQGYIKGDFTYNLDLDSTLKVIANASKTKSVEKPLYALATPSGIKAGAGLFSDTTIEGTVTLTNKLVVNINGTAGAGCGLDGLIVAWPVNVRSYGSTDFHVNNEVTLEAEVNITEKVYLGLFVELFGFSIIKADAGAGPYIDLFGMIKGWVDYVSKTKSLTSGWEYEGSIELGVFTEVTGSIFDGKWGGTIYEKKYPLYRIETSGGSRNVPGNETDSIKTPEFMARF